MLPAPGDSVRGEPAAPDGTGPPDSSDAGDARWLGDCGSPEGDADSVVAGGRETGGATGGGWAVGRSVGAGGGAWVLVGRGVGAAITTAGGATEVSVAVVVPWPDPLVASNE